MLDRQGLPLVQPLLGIVDPRHILEQLEQSDAGRICENEAVLVLGQLRQIEIVLKDSVRTNLASLKGTPPLGSAAGQCRAESNDPTPF